MKHEVYLTATCHLVNIPNFLRDIVQKSYEKHYNEVVNLFNEHIDSANKIWDMTEEPFAFGDTSEDFNPKYVRCIQRHIQPYIDVLNRRLLFCRYRLGECAEIVGYVPFLPKSIIWMTFRLKD